MKVLVVDDNPMILRLLKRAVMPLARQDEVKAVTSAAAALEEISRGAPDLVICDFRMPGMDGWQLLEKLRATPALEHLPFVLVASHNDLTERLKSLQDSVEDLLEKPFFVSEISVRIKRILHKIALENLARDAHGGATVRGALAQMGVIDLLQSLEMGRKTCSLLLARNGEQCRLFFSDGQIVHAAKSASPNPHSGAQNGLSGDEAVYAALAWPESEGEFAIDFTDSSAEQTTTRTTQGLLMEGLRLLDESRRNL